MRLLPLFLCIPFVMAHPSMAQDAKAPSASPESLVAESQASPEGSPPHLTLTCIGGGDAAKANVTSASVYGSNGASASGWSTQTSYRGFDGQIDVALFAGDDRIRLPRIMLPPAHGGANGWFKIKNLAVTEREITGKAALNLVNTPKFRIDRVTGNIEVSGLNGDFAGQCHKIDPELDKPKF